jgi:hypothetical protein
VAVIAITSSTTTERALRRSLAAGALLLALYVGLSFANDPRGFLGTDTGGKVATLRVMDARHRLDPDVGYWAARWDPEGRVHPLYYTSHIGRRWVNATTLPMLYAAQPLYRLGGYRLALLVPMLGAVAAAFAAREIARRIHDTDGRLAFWIVGLASPLTIYALDLWEHTLGVALVAWAVVFLFDSVAGDRRRGAVVAGVLLGLAATMRTEALVYAALVTAGACGVLLMRRRVRIAVATGLVVVVGMAVPLAANQALERATAGGAIRSSRAGALASDSRRSDAAVRAQEGVLTLSGLTADLERRAELTGLILLALLLVFVGASAEPDQRRVAAVAGAGVALLYLLRLVKGLGFVPGLVATTPTAAVAFVRGWTRERRLVTALACAALPLVWAVQYTGGAPPQWGGRYLLVSGLLLGVVGTVALAQYPPWARGAFVVAAVTITAFGLAWTSVRTHDVARASRALTRQPEPALLFREPHLAREAGAFYDPARRWLTADSEENQARAFAVFRAAGIGVVGIVAIERGQPDVDVGGWRAQGRRHIRLFSDVDLRVTTYRAA